MSTKNEAARTLGLLVHLDLLGEILGGFLLHGLTKNGSG